MPSSQSRSARAGLSNAWQLVVTLGLTFLVGGPLMWWLLDKEAAREQERHAEQFLRTQAEIEARHGTHDKVVRDLSRRYPAMTQPIPRATSATVPSPR